MNEPLDQVKSEEKSLRNSSEMKSENTSPEPLVARLIFGVICGS